MVFFDETNLMREWARAVQARSQYRLGIGDVDGAIDDIVTLYRLGRQVGRQETYLSGMTATALDSVACAAGIGSNPKFPASKEQLERLVREIDALPPRVTFEQCHEFERRWGNKEVLEQYKILSMTTLREVWRRAECQDNIMRLTLALLLHEKDHGKLPGEDGDWRVAVRPYLGKNPDKYFRCPSRELPEGETTYAMLSGVSNTSPTPFQILIVETFQPQQLGKGNGRIPLEKAVFAKRNGDDSLPDDFDGIGGSHRHVTIFGLRNGSARVLSATTAPEVLRQLVDGTATTIP